MGRSALAAVQTGWTGQVSVTFGGRTATVVPRTRESCASLLARLIHDTLAQTELPLAFVIGASSHVLSTTSAGDVFDFASSGTCATRLDLASASSVASVSGTATSLSGVWIPTYGVRLDGATLTSEPGRATSDGSAGYSIGARLGTVPLKVTTTHADAWTREASISGVYDVWCDGVVHARVRVDQWRRSALGRGRTTSVPYLLECDAQGVAE